MTRDTQAEAAKAAAKVTGNPGARAWQLAAALGWDKDRTGRALAAARNRGLVRGGHGGWWPADDATDR